MSKVFISYDRQSRPQVEGLADDIEALEHEVWYDREISPGLLWWKTILKNIRKCDVFVFALTPRALEREACIKEYEYAHALRKPILPVRLSDEVSTDLLPEALPEVHYVDYLNPDDKKVAFELNKALNAIPPSKTLPDPLPEEPAMPVTYMSRLTQRVRAASIDEAEQLDLLEKLKERLLDPEYDDEAGVLLRRMLEKHELAKEVKSEIKELLGIATLTESLAKKSVYKPIAATAVIFLIGIGLYLRYQYLQNIEQEFERQRIVRLVIPTMETIPAGSFQMGSVTGYDNERPVHTVNIQSFRLSRYEVTFEDYDAYTNATDTPLWDDEGWGRENRPVINVSWNDVQGYIQWLNEETAGSYRLPSEAEWEYAARAGTTTNYSWGDEIGVNNANCPDCGSKWDEQQTAPVGSFAANPFGLYDMHGNVCEWVQDVYVANYEGAPVDGTSVLEGGDSRSLRGGCLLDVARIVRGSVRWGLNPDVGDDYVGFRLAQDISL